MSIIRLLHQISALILLVFILAHIGNHAAGALGIDFYQDYLSVMRRITRHPIGEPALISIILVQAITGLNLIIEGLKRPEPRKLQSWAELTSAMIFLGFIIIHLLVIAVTRYYFEVETGFYWMATLLQSSRIQPLIIGFHVLGVMAILLHAGVGLYYLFSVLRMPTIGLWAGIFFFVCGTVATAIGIAAYSGVFYPIEYGF